MKLKALSAKASILFFGGAFLFSAATARGNGAVNWDYYDGFVPSTVVISPGQKVTWSNVDGISWTEVTIPTNSISFFLQVYSSVSETFTNAGNYAYSSSYGDQGTVIVGYAPTVSITAPANGLVILGPVTLTVQASAAETSPDVMSDVQFFLGTRSGTNFIADVTAPPYSVGLTNLAAGNYTLIAKANDPYGLSATNAIAITVYAINLVSPRTAAGHFVFNVTGLTAGKTNVVQVSTNLASWLPWQTNIASGTSMSVTNTGLVGTNQFFRVVQLP